MNGFWNFPRPFLSGKHWIFSKRAARRGMDGAGQSRDRKCKDGGEYRGYENGADAEIGCLGQSPHTRYCVVHSILLSGVDALLEASIGGHVWYTVRPRQVRQVHGIMHAYNVCGTPYRRVLARFRHPGCAMVHVAARQRGLRN